MLQLSEKTESSLTKSIASISNSVPKLSKVLDLEKSKETGVWAVEPKKLHITINDPVTVNAPKLLTEGDKEEKSMVKAEKMPLSKSAAAAALKEETRAKRIQAREEKREARAQKWRDSVKDWQGNMMDATKNAIVDNPVVNFFKNHWGKLLLGIGFLFLKPSQMKKVWEALKSAGLWLWKNAPRIFEGIWSVLETVGTMIGDLIDWLFGKTEKQTEQEKLKKMKEEGPRKGIFGIGGETPEEFEARLQEQRDKVNNADDKKLVGGLNDSLFKKIAVGLGGLSLLLLKFGPKGSLFKVVELGAKGIWKTAKGLTNVIKNPGEAIDKSAKWLGNKAGKVKNVATKVGGVTQKVGGVAQKVGGVAKKVGKVGGDWFKTLMGKFGSAGKFLMKMGKSVIQGLMTMGPYGWAILAGIAIGGLVWYFWDDISKAWDSISSTISEGFTKIKDSIVGAFKNIQGMVGGWLRGIGANMIADWIDPSGADPDKPKEEFTWGGFAGEIWNIVTGIWDSIVNFLSIDVNGIRSATASWLRGVGAGLIADWIEPDEAKKTGEEPTFTNLMKSLNNIVNGYIQSILDFIGIDVNGIKSAVASWLRGVGASILADWIEPDETKKENEKEVTFINIAQELSTALGQIWDDMWAALKDIDVMGVIKDVVGGVKNAVGDFLGLGPDTPEEEQQAKDNENLLDVYDHHLMGKSKIDRKKILAGIKTGKTTRRMLETIVKHDDLNDEDMDFVKGLLKDPHFKKTAVKVPKVNPPTTETATEKEPESEGGFWGMPKWGGLFGGGEDEKQSPTPSPRVSPTLKSDTLNQVQGENSELSSASTAVVAPVTNNYITNNNGGGGEGGTAIYGVPTAQKGNQHRHSNIK